MRGAMPSPEFMLFLIGSVAMEKEYKSYSYPVTAFRDVEELKKKQRKEVAVWFKNMDNFFNASLKVTHIFKPNQQQQHFINYTLFKTLP